MDRTISSTTVVVCALSVDKKVQLPPQLLSEWDHSSRVTQDGRINLTRI